MIPWLCKVFGHDWSAIFTRATVPPTHYQKCRRCLLERNVIDAVEIKS